MIYAENILLCIVIPFLVSLVFIRGETRRYTATFLLGMVMCLIAAYISGFLSLVSGMSENDTSIFISPVVEELIKLLPLLFFMVMFQPKDNTFVMLAVFIGVGFATFENCCYILSFGADSLPYILIRGLAVGVMHIVSILALSIWLIITRQLKAFSFPAVVGGLSLSMVFHALYNLLVSEPGASRVIGYILPLFAAVSLYPLYRKVTRLLE